MTFWTDSKKFEPKQNFKWKVVLGVDSKTSFYATSVTKPNFEVKTRKFKHMNIEENFPGDITWSPVVVTFVDTVDNFILNKIHEYFKLNGLSLDSSSQEYYGYERKKRLPVEIRLFSNEDIGENNKKAVEIWNLVNAFPVNLEMDKLDYRNDELHTYRLTFAYDWAKTGEIGAEASSGAATVSKRDITGKIEETQKQSQDSRVSEGSASPASLDSDEFFKGKQPADDNRAKVRSLRNTETDGTPAVIPPLFDGSSS